MPVLVLLFIASFASGAIAQERGPLDLANAPVRAGAQQIAYGSDPLQFGELRLPAGPGPHPVAIVVHGGCWVAHLDGLDDRAIAIDNMRPLAAALAAAGIATWNIEYRRLGNAGGGWPGTFRDVARAAEFLRTLAREQPLDLDRVVAIGHSAGGHFALWLAARAAIPPDSELYQAEALPLAGALSLDGPADLAATIPLQQMVCRTPVITDLLGGSPGERPDRYRAASPIEMLAAGQSFEFFAGQMFAAQAEPYAARARASGDEVRLTVLADANHFAFIDPESAIWPQVLQAVQRLLNQSR
jgi:acetyl esterase/lipase